MLLNCCLRSLINRRCEDETWDVLCIVRSFNYLHAINYSRFSHRRLGVKTESWTISLSSYIIKCLWFSVWASWYHSLFYFIHLSNYTLCILAVHIASRPFRSLTLLWNDWSLINETVDVVSDLILCISQSTWVSHCVRVWSNSIWGIDHVIWAPF